MTEIGCCMQQRFSQPSSLVTRNRGALRADQYLLATALTHLAVLATDGPTSKQPQSTIVGVIPHLQSVARTQGPRMIFYQICYTLNISSSRDAVLLRVVERRSRSRRAYVSYQGCMCCLYSVCDQCRSIQLREKLAFVFLGATISCPV